MKVAHGYRRCEVSSEDGKIKFYECLLHESQGLDIGHIINQIRLPFKVTVIGGGGTTIHHYKEDRSIVSESDHEIVTGKECAALRVEALPVKVVTAGLLDLPCRDCYHGLNGQLELCERHRS